MAVSFFFFFFVTRGDDDFRFVILFFLSNAVVECALIRKRAALTLSSGGDVSAPVRRVRAARAPRR